MKSVFEPLGEREVIAKMLELYTNIQTLAVTVRQRLIREERGQTMAEYGVVLGVITVALVAVFALLGDDIKATINAVRAKLPK
jgi:Flp pilus assembly pilin Flp